MVGGAGRLSDVVAFRGVAVPGVVRAAADGAGCVLGAVVPM
jgi:hypothetical protein